MVQRKGVHDLSRWWAPFEIFKRDFWVAGMVAWLIQTAGRPRQWPWLSAKERWLFQSGCRQPLLADDEHSGIKAIRIRKPLSQLRCTSSRQKRPLIKCRRKQFPKPSVCYADDAVPDLASQRFAGKEMLRWLDKGEWSWRSWWLTVVGRPNYHSGRLK